MRCTKRLRKYTDHISDEEWCHCPFDDMQYLRRSFEGRASVYPWGRICDRCSYRCHRSRKEGFYDLVLHSEAKSKISKEL